MRTEQEMYDLILGYAKSDDRIRAVILNGSRANPNAPRDCYQDYDIVYVVTELAPFLADQSWLNLFGPRLILQMPEAMRYPSGLGHFNWMMLFTDGNRLDLTLIPLEKLSLLDSEPASVVLLDKAGILPPFPPPGEILLQKPDELFYSSCCNNFWWCLQNVAKGIKRDELPYAMMMFHTIVREELHDMISWYIGVHTDFSVSAGKLGKYFKRYLPPNLYQQYCATYSDCTHLWQSVFTACDLFRTTAKEVGNQLGYPYSTADDDGMMQYLHMLHDSD